MTDGAQTADHITKSTQDVLESVAAEHGPSSQQSTVPSTFFKLKFELYKTGATDPMMREAMATGDPKALGKVI